MTVSSQQQMKVFLISILIGILCGIFFDFERSIRKIYGGGTFQTTFQDILFMVVCAALTIAVGFRYNKGQIRYFEIFGAACGGLVFSITLSRLILKFFCFFHKVFITVVLKPIHFVIRTAANLLKRAGQKAAHLIRKVKKILKNTSEKLGKKGKRIKKRIKML